MLCKIRIKKLKGCFCIEAGLLRPRSENWISAFVHQIGKREEKTATTAHEAGKRERERENRSARVKTDAIGLQMGAKVLGVVLHFRANDPSQSPSWCRRVLWADGLLET